MDTASNAGSLAKAGEGVGTGQTASKPGTSIVKWDKYPPENVAPRGYLGGWSKDELLPTGAILSRYGRTGGTYASPLGTPFAARGLPPEFEAYGESLYQLTEPLGVKAGIAAYWQGGGFGIQYELPGSVQSLLDSGILKVYEP